MSFELVMKIAAVILIYIEEVKKKHAMCIDLISVYGTVCWYYEWDVTSSSQMEEEEEEGRSASTGSGLFETRMPRKVRESHRNIASTDKTEEKINEQFHKTSFAVVRKS